MGFNVPTTSKLSIPLLTHTRNQSLISVPTAFVPNTFCSSGNSRSYTHASRLSTSNRPLVRAELKTPSSKVPPLIHSPCDRTDLSTVDRKTFLRIMACISLSVLPFEPSVLAETEFSTYKGPISLGFSFSYPSSWNVTKKAIKTHLSEVIVANKDEASTSAGLVVDSVKIDSIDNFGTPEVVGQKVVDVEKKKDSVNDASVISANAIQDDGLTYYVIDYTVDSSRGQKRYIAKVTVTGKQLYVFTAQAKVDNFKGETANVFTKMLESFSVKKQYS